MERSAAVGKTFSAFVKWEEVFSTNHKGRREVRYYLKRRDGTSVLAVVGKEKNSGHNMKPSSSSSYPYRYAIRDKSLFLSTNLPFEFYSKLRSRREVIDWLSSFVTDGSFSRPPQPVDGFLGAGDALRVNLETFTDVHLHKMSQHTAEFLWVGSAWTCRKKRKHYEAYSRSGVRISVHNFVYVLAEEGKRLVAYLDDLYEDSRGNKMAVVRWFHKVDEVGLDLPHSYNDKEIFFSLCLQDLSIECIDGLATVLSPQHYEKFLKVDAHTKLDPFVCRHQFDNEVVKPFDITQVKGYWKQNIHRFMSLTTSNGCPKLQSTDATKLESSHLDAVGIRPRKKLRRLVDTEMQAVPTTIKEAGVSGPLDGEVNFKERTLAEYASMQKHQYTIGSEIEVLSQDSGIRGIWFKAVVIKKHKDKLKVRYQDIKDADNESINLEEWILSSRVAAPDHLGIRHCGRMTIRPSRLCKNSDVCFVDVGCIVDAWLHDGWWEGIVVHKESDDRIHVYFPGEKQRSILGCKDLRYSEEWLGDRWKQMKSRPDLLGPISSAIETNSQTTKSHDNGSSLTGTIHDKELSSGPKDNSLENSVVGRDFEVVDHADFLTHLNWKWSARKRHGKNPSHRLQRHASKTNDVVAVETRKRNRLLMVKMDHVKCKFTCESSLFRSSVASSPLTSLAMSR
ncbi:uncharacterized protein LOC112523554 [Cynara cardunculus var. scolymus]|uniref:Agenet-like domain-containing protein n=1 Tax=Cynara cardunculus var. scolymus TaxID=59895 RepID=A0A103XVG1_CYNCS|nr:uncharacterized protein LOC112523554 [Cynara cardunculus var. scolymus]KVH97634.1 Agenet-like domain-containing protein [Cynara cardunculus var. scolymus]